MAEEADVALGTLQAGVLLKYGGAGHFRGVPCGDDLAVERTLYMAWS